MLAFLDFHKIPYKVVEVNPLTKTELAWSTYKKACATRRRAAGTLTASRSLHGVRQPPAASTAEACLWRARVRRSPCSWWTASS